MNWSYKESKVFEAQGEPVRNYVEKSFYVTLLSMFTRTQKALCATGMSLLLALSMVLPFVGGTQKAYADELSDAQATLDAASAELSEISAEYNELQTEINNLDAEISTTTQKVQEAQQAMLEGQELLGDAVLAEYKSDGGLSLVNIVLSSESISDFVTNMTYYAAVQEDQAEKIAEQRKLNETFNDALDELNNQRDSQQAVLDQAEAKKAEAEKVVSDASAKVSSIKESQAELAKLQAQAAQMEQSNSANNASSNKEESSNWNTNNERPAASGGNSGGTSSGGNSGGNSGGGSSSNNSGGTSSTDASKGWKSGPASAYGGSSDPYTPNPGTTATGAVCDDNSMGVAIPVSWPNRSSYYGHAIEIKYGGKTVVATINDCGGLSGGARHLDLQPGVFKAFGFKTCQAWGVRTVSYRIL